HTGVRINTDLYGIQADKLPLVIHPAHVGINELGRKSDVEKLAGIEQEEPIPASPAVVTHTTDLPLVVDVRKQHCRPALPVSPPWEGQRELTAVVDEPVVLQRRVRRGVEPVILPEDLPAIVDAPEDGVRVGQWKVYRGELAAVPLVPLETVDAKKP